MTNRNKQREVVNMCYKQAAGDNKEQEAAEGKLK
jgi:hypothetical protein